MNSAKQIVQKNYQRLASWSALLSLLLFFVVGANQGQSSISPFGQQDLVSLTGVPELAAVQIKPSPVQHVTEDLWGNGPEADFSVSPSVSVLLATADWSGARSAWSVAHGLRPNSPRAPPGG